MTRVIIVRNGWHDARHPAAYSAYVDTIDEEGPSGYRRTAAEAERDLRDGWPDLFEENAE